MKDLQIFNHEKFGQVRILLKDGKEYFLANDIAKALAYKRPNDAINQHCRYTSKYRIPHPQSEEKEIEVNFITEGDVYRLIVGASKQSKNESIKRKAEEFESWVFDEVLPSIRKHGTYMTDEIIEKVLTDPDTIIKLATQLKETKKELKEKNRFIGQLAASKNSILVRQVAKVAAKNGVVIGEKRLWNKLREWGLIFKNSTEPIQEYVDRGYFEVSEGVKESSKGTFSYRTTRVTGKGQVYIIERLLKEQIGDEVAVARELV